MDINGAGGRNGIIAPHFIEQFVARQHSATMSNEVSQHLEFERRHFYRLPMLSNLRFTEVHLYIAEPVSFE